MSFGDADTDIDTLLNNIGEWTSSRDLDIFVEGLLLNFFMLEPIELFIKI